MGSDHPAPRIYVFVNSVSPVATAGGNPYNGTALAEDGNVVATCQSRNLTALKYDLGVTSHQAHDKYKAKYPDGYMVELVGPDDAIAEEKNPGFFAALLKAKEKERG